MAVWMNIHYQSRRSDLDDSLILDAMQGRVFKNDRQVRERHIFGYIDRDNPRTDIVVTQVGASNPL